MPFTFESADGKRSQGVFDTLEEALDAKKKDPEFRYLLVERLGRGYKLSEFRIRKDAQVTPDVPEHMNAAFGCVVRSRRHLRDLQKRTDSVDYEPSAKQKERDAYARDRMKFEASRL